MIGGKSFLKEVIKTSKLKTFKTRLNRVFMNIPERVILPGCRVVGWWMIWQLFGLLRTLSCTATPYLNTLQTISTQFPPLSVYLSFLWALFSFEATSNMILTWKLYKSAFVFKIQYIHFYHSSIKGNFISQNIKDTHFSFLKRNINFWKCKIISAQ